MDPRLNDFDHIAAIGVYVVLHALRLLNEVVCGKALFMFNDNIHAVGCLSRQASSLTGTDLAKTLNIKHQHHGRLSWNFHEIYVTQ